MGPGYLPMPLNLYASAMSIKNEVVKAIEEMPSGVSITDIQYRIYVLEKIRTGRGALKKHGGIPHEKVAARLKKWLIK